MSTEYSYIKLRWFSLMLYYSISYTNLYQLLISCTNSNKAM